MELTDPEMLGLLMKRKGLGNVHLADKVGCGESFIRALRTGRRNSCKPDLAFRICLELGLTDTSLLFASKEATAGVNSSTTGTSSKAAA